LSVEVRGHDLKEGRKISLKVANILEKYRRCKRCGNIEKEGRPELQVTIDREKASLLGLNVASISIPVETSFQGAVATYYREAGEEYDVEVRLREEDRNIIENLENLLVPLPSGGQITLSQIAAVEKATGPLKIERKGRERVVKIEGEIYGRDLGSVVTEVKGKLKTLELPPGFSIYFGGEFEEQQKSFKAIDSRPGSWHNSCIHDYGEPV